MSISLSPSFWLRLIFSPSLFLCLHLSLSLFLYLHLSLSLSSSLSESLFLYLHLSLSPCSLFISISLSVSISPSSSLSVSLSPSLSVSFFLCLYLSVFVSLSCRFNSQYYLVYVFLLIYWHCIGNIEPLILLIIIDLLFVLCCISYDFTFILIIFQTINNKKAVVPHNASLALCASRLVHLRPFAPHTVLCA